MKEILYDVIQSNFAPVVCMFIFLQIINADLMIEKRIKTLFKFETVFVLIMMIVTISEIILGGMSGSAVAYARSFANFLYFGAAPVAFIVITNIYRDLSKEKWFIYYLLPEAFNMVVCGISSFTGMVFHVSKDNIYSRGPLYFIPFLIAGFYCLFFLYASTLQPKKQSVREESIFLMYVFTAVIISLVIEIVTTHYFVLWTVTCISIILYFLLINIHKISYDSLSDAYTRTVYTRFLEANDKKHPFTVAMIDINNLKFMNDNYGHVAGDEVVVRVASTILKYKSKDMRLYRYGGDEFILTGKPYQSDEIKMLLEKCRLECGEVNGHKITFAYGVSEYKPDMDLHITLREIDKYMYEDKKQYKALNGIESQR